MIRCLANRFFSDQIYVNSGSATFYEEDQVTQQREIFYSLQEAKIIIENGTRITTQNSHLRLDGRVLMHAQTLTRPPIPIAIQLLHPADVEEVAGLGTIRHLLAESLFTAATR